MSGYPDATGFVMNVDEIFITEGSPTPSRSLCASPWQLAVKH